MSINCLLQDLPGGESKTSACVRFEKLDLLRSRPPDIDTGTLICVSALQHKDAYNVSKYLPAAGEFQRQVISLNLLYKWDTTLVFDGQPPDEKRHEHTRRCGDDNHVVIKAEFIAICKRHFIHFIVSPAEADMQVGKIQTGAVVVCRDSDETAYGNLTVVIVDS